jgi:glutathione synthase/RimK-type ligase-like ATP-grasp enzyme
MQIAFATYRGHPAITDDDRPIAELLGRHGIRVDGVPWDAPADWTRYDAVLPRTTWDFHLRLPEFCEWMAALDAAGTPMLNASGVLRWNLTKRYLAELAEHDVPVVPTLWVTDAGGPTLSDAVAGRGWHDGVVVKPIVSASGHGTWTATDAERGTADARFSAALAIAPYGLMVQPFLPRVQSHGEWSLIFLGGRYSHAVIKRPAAGEFRVQHEHGGAAEVANPTPRLIEDARRALTAAAQCTDRAPADLVYARVDGIEDDGGLLLMELELIEPALHLDASPEAPGRMAEVIEAALRRS